MRDRRARFPRRVALGVVAVAVPAIAALVIVRSHGGAGLRPQADTPGPPHRPARILVLDARTGRTLLERRIAGGYAVATLLADGRIAVGTYDACPGDHTAAVTVYDSTLRHVLSNRRTDACVVAGLSPSHLRMNLDGTPGPMPLEPYEWAGSRVTLPVGRGRVAEYGTLWMISLEGSDASGRVTWKRSTADDHFGSIAVQGNRLLVPVLGDYKDGRGD